MTINNCILPAVGRTLAFSAACCLILGGMACDGVGSQRSCEAITADIASNLPDGGGIPSAEDLCDNARLTIESIDAGCLPDPGGLRDALAEQLPELCGG